MKEKNRIQNQDDWKRTQVRMPQEQYADVVKYAEENNISLNTAMLDLMDKGLNLPSWENLFPSARDTELERLNRKFDDLRADIIELLQSKAP